MYLCREARQAVLAQVRALHGDGHRLPDTFLFRSRVGGNRLVGRRTAWRVAALESARVALESMVPVFTEGPNGPDLVRLGRTKWPLLGTFDHRTEKAGKG